MRLRDLIASLLVNGISLRVSDAGRVLNLGAITDDHLRRRLRIMPKAVGAIVQRLLESDRAEGD